MILAPFLLAFVQQAAPAPVPPARPRDPFVFRCVLDLHPRMITVALDDDMWIAYDAARCALYKAWKGGVLFDGPVYTTVHGPQPTTQGVAYTRGIAGEAWSASQEGRPVACTSRYAGYRLSAGRVTLEWRITLAGGAEVVVLESPEFVRPGQVFSAQQLDDLVLGAGDQPGLQRAFEARGLPAGTQMSLTLRTDGTVGKFGLLERERFEDVLDEAGNVTATRVLSQMPLTAARPKNAVVLFFAPVKVELPAVPAPGAKGGEKQ